MPSTTERHSTKPDSSDQEPDIHTWNQMQSDAVEQDPYGSDQEKNF